jgi:Na+(H+)/acetate symporter ActP
LAVTLSLLFFFILLFCCHAVLGGQKVHRTILVFAVSFTALMLSASFQVADASWLGLTEHGQSIENAGKSVEHGFVQHGKSIENASTNLGHSVEHASANFGQSVENAGNSIMWGLVGLGMFYLMSNRWTEISSLWKGTRSEN